MYSSEHAGWDDYQNDLIYNVVFRRNTTITCSSEARNVAGSIGATKQEEEIVDEKIRNFKFDGNYDGYKFNFFANGMIKSVYDNDTPGFDSDLSHSSMLPLLKFIESLLRKLTLDHTGRSKTPVKMVFAGFGSASDIYYLYSCAVRDLGDLFTKNFFGYGFEISPTLYSEGSRIMSFFPNFQAYLADASVINFPTNSIVYFTFICGPAIVNAMFFQALKSNSNIVVTFDVNWNYIMSPDKKNYGDEILLYNSDICWPMKYTSRLKSSGEERQTSIGIISSTSLPLEMMINVDVINQSLK
jgi:hypothetical protein